MNLRISSIAHLLVPLLALVAGVCCDRPEISDTGEGQGYIVFHPEDLMIKDDITIASKAFNPPAITDFNLKITNQSTGTVVYNDKIFTEARLFDIGTYTVQIQYGDKQAVAIDAPAFEASTTTIVTAASMSRISLTATLQNGVIEPEIVQTLANQFTSYHVKITCGTTNVDVTPGIIGGTPGPSLFVPVGSTVSCTLIGTNQLGESVSFPLVETPNIQAATRYKVNCDASLPQFTLPAQAEGDIWGSTLYLTEMTATNVTRGNAEKVLTNIIYEASSDGGTHWITAQPSGTRKAITGLTPGTTYTVRSRFIDIPSSNTQTVTTEGALQLTNGNMEGAWSSTQLYGGSGISQAVYIYEPGNKEIWATRNAKTTNGAENANGNIVVSKANFSTRWRWYSGTLETSDCSQGSKATEISTLAFYNQKINYTGWNRTNIFTYTKNDGTAYPGYLLTGSYDKVSDTYTLGVPHNARPLSVSFDYKYAPTAGDQCLAYAVLYDQAKNEIAKTSTFAGGGQSNYTRQTLSFTYTHTTQKAGYIGLFFQSGTNTDITKMAIVKGDYNATPYYNDRVMGSVLKIDNIILNY